MDKTSSAIIQLLKTVRTLRSPGGCNWDREQTLQSLRPYMLEEAYEVADAVDNNDMEELKKELGDLLLHIIMASDIAEDNNDFSLFEVVNLIDQKLKRRHPHVFNSASDLSPEEVEKQWETIKSKEKKKANKKFFDSIPSAMPELQKSWRIQQRASEVGFKQKSIEGSRSDIKATIEKSKLTEDNLGFVLFQLINLSRLSGLEPEKALRKTNSDFIDRFNKLEELLSDAGCSLHDVEEEKFQELVAIAFD